MSRKFLYVREFEGELIIIPDLSFYSLNPKVREELRNKLQKCADSANLPGTVALIWKNSRGITDFFAPSEWYNALKDTRYEDVVASTQGELLCEF
jgi:hypothetical protein